MRWGRKRERGMYGVWCHVRGEREWEVYYNPWNERWREWKKRCRGVFPSTVFFSCLSLSLFASEFGFFRCASLNILCLTRRVERKSESERTERAAEPKGNEMKKQRGQKEGKIIIRKRYSWTEEAASLFSRSIPKLDNSLNSVTERNTSQTIEKERERETERQENGKKQWQIEDQTQKESRGEREDRTCETRWTDDHKKMREILYVIFDAFSFPPREELYVERKIGRETERKTRHHFILWSEVKGKSKGGGGGGRMLLSSRVTDTHETDQGKREGNRHDWLTLTLGEGLECERQDSGNG